MNKLFLAFCLTITTSVFAFAQSSDYKKVEGYVGFSNQQVDSGVNTNNSGVFSNGLFNKRLSFNGFEVAGVYNVSRFVGLKADFSGAYRKEDFAFTSGTGTAATTLNLRTNNSLYNVLGGVQIKDNSSTSRVKPFAHALVGVGHTRTKIGSLTCSSATPSNCAGAVGTGSSFNDTGLAGAFGGGLDIKLSDHVDLRAIQADYNPIRTNGSTDNNFRLGIGLVFK